MSIFERLLIDLPFNSSELRILIQTGPHRYKVHNIEKRRGGKRLIAQPTAELKLLQRWVVQNVLKQLPLHDAAKAYRIGGSTKAHAAPHAKSKFLMKLDFENFFPSLGERALAYAFRNAKISISDEDRRVLSRILFRFDRAIGRLSLSIGAPSSPAVSNLVMFRFDSLLSEVCSKSEVVYTRYADDLAFSTDVPYALDGIKAVVTKLCLEEASLNLKLNEAKTVNVSRKFHRELTGITLSNDGRLSLGHAKRRLIRSMIDRYSKGLFDEEQVRYLQGLLAYAISIDPSVFTLAERRLSREGALALLRGIPAASIK